MFELLYFMACWRRHAIEPFSGGAPTLQCASPVSSRTASPLIIAPWYVAHRSVGTVAQSEAGANNIDPFSSPNTENNSESTHRFR